MRAELFGIEGPWPGRLTIVLRPRGGDWLEEQIQAWRRSGVDLVVSLLTSEESAEFNLMDEERLCRANGIDFISFPILDRSVPTSLERFSELITALAEQLMNGKNVAVHCRQGIGRAGLVAVCLLISTGIDQGAAITRVSSARGCAVPETPGQQQWIADYEKSLAVQGAK